jgi:hypothetical protein
LRPSGEKSGDSGSSTIVIGMRCTMLCGGSTSWMISVRDFSLRTK